MRTTRLLCAAAAVAILFLAGCGGDGGGGALSKSEYQKQFKATVSKYNEKAKAIKDPADNASAQERGKTATDAAEVVDAMADDLGDLKPPAEVAQAHKDLVASLHETADLTKEAAQKLSDGDQKGAQAAILKLQSSGVQKKAAQAQKTFQSKGYDLGLGQQLFGQ